MSKWWKSKQLSEQQAASFAALHRDGYLRINFKGWFQLTEKGRSHAEARRFIEEIYDFVFVQEN
jgi:hypothetical protein